VLARGFNSRHSQSFLERRERILPPSFNRMKDADVAQFIGTNPRCRRSRVGLSCIFQEFQNVLPCGESIQERQAITLKPVSDIVGDRLIAPRNVIRVLESPPHVQVVVVELSEAAVNYTMLAPWLPWSRELEKETKQLR
jgi:hypothetical protein